MVIFYNSYVKLNSSVNIIQVSSKNAFLMMLMNWTVNCTIIHGTIGAKYSIFAIVKPPRQITIVFSKLPFIKLMAYTPSYDVIITY